MNKYYCRKCKKFHYRGKIYEEHLNFNRKKLKKDTQYDDKEIKININKLRPIAKRQLNRLFKKAKSTGNHELYKKEIIKLIKNEKRE